MASGPSTSEPVSLRLTWPTFIHYYSDQVDPTTEGAIEPPRDPDQHSTSSKCNDYNGVPLEILGEAQNLCDDEFRLLDLHPGELDTPLIGALRKVRLSGHDEYEPLSYTWEDHPTDVTKDDNDIHPFLYLDHNYEAGAYIELQTNCARALYRIRDDRDIKTIWVDAICINQADLAERSRQVSLMERIYARPHTVVAYVGHESQEQHSHMAMWLLNHPEMLSTGALDDFQLSSIHHFVRRPYFQRMWIVQECALATSLKLICGPDEVYISEFTQTSLEMLVAAEREAIPAWLKHSRQISSIMRQEGSAQAKQLLDLMFDTASCECSDIRDRIFALFSLLGLGSDEDTGSDKRLVADYSLSIEQVYSGIAAFFVANGFLGTILRLAALTRGDSVRCMPSWVPDWSQITVGMRDTLQDQVEDNIIWDIYSRTSTNRDLGISFPKLWNSGAITFQGLLLGEVDISGYLLRPASLNMKTSAVCVPSRDFSCTVFLKERYFGSGDHQMILSRPQFSSRPERSRLSLRTKDYVRLHFTDFDPSTPLSDSEQLKYSQMLPQHLEKLKKWPHLWTRPLEVRFPAPRLKSGIVECMCSVRTNTLSTLRSLWQEWQEQAPLGQWILGDEDQIQLVLDEIERFGSLDQVWKPTWPSSRPDQIYYTGDDYGGFAFASFLALFIKDPDILKQNSEPVILSQQPLRRTKASLALGSIENKTVEKALTQHLMDWAQTTFALFAELQNENVDQDLRTWARLTSSDRFPTAAIHLWWDACNTIRYQCRVANLMCPGEQPTRHATFLLKKIRHELPQARKPGIYPHGRRRVEGEEYWDWSKLTHVFSPELLEWASAEADQDKVRLLRQSMDDKTWDAFKNKLEMVEMFGEGGVNLVKPEFTTFKIV